MDNEQLRRLFPNASAATLAANSGAVNVVAIDHQTSYGSAMNVQELWADYLVSGSVHKTGPKFGICGETVRQAFRKNGLRLNRSAWTPQELEKLKAAYSENGGVNPQYVAVQVGRSAASVSCKASELGICVPVGTQTRTLETRYRMSVAQRARLQEPAEKEKLRQKAIRFHQENEHPKGMLGKHHTQESKDAISRFHKGKKPPRERVERQMKTKQERHGALAPATKRGSWRAEWVEVGGQRFFARSLWESNYARYLEWLRGLGEIRQWEHEPKTFWFEQIKRGVRSYLPDFRVVLKTGAVEWHEVKGWMDAKSKTKIRRMRKYHPSEVLRVLDGKWFKDAARKLAPFVHGWISSAKPRKASKKAR